MLQLQLVYLLHLQRLAASAAGGSSSAGGLGGGGSSSSSGEAPSLVSVVSAAAALADGLLLEDRDEGALPPDVSAQGYSERNVQALMAAVSLPRSAALDALKAAGGEVAEALRRQLMRLRLDTAEVDALVWQYAVSRCDML